MEREKTCCFSGHRPNKLPWRENEGDPRCVALKESIRRAVEGALAEPEPRTGADWRRLLARRGLEAARAAAALWGGEAALEAVLPDPWRMEDLALRGRDLRELGLEGAEIGAALARLRAHVLERPEDNRREILLALARGEGER